MNQSQTKLIESVKLALNVVWTHRLRSILVMLGVAMAVTTLMGMVSILSGLSNRITQEITGGETVILQISKFDLAGGNRREQSGRKDFTTEDARALGQLPHVNGVDIFYQQGQPLRHRNHKARLMTVMGSSTLFPAFNKIAVDQGRFFSPFEVDHRRSVAVLGAQPARELFPGEDPIGQHLRISNQEYQIVGVFAENESIFARMFGSLAQNFVVVPHTAYRRDFKGRREPMFLRLIIDRQDNLDQVRDDARALLRARRKVMPGLKDDFSMTTADAMLELVERITGPIGLVLVIMASIGLMVGGIGVMVIMLVAVTERTHEIGLRKALGATRREIMLQFLVEAAVLTCLGGIIGIIGGLGLAYAITQLGDLPFSLPIFWVLAAVVVSVGIGIVFGLYPANRAASLDPVEAWRFEV